MTSPPPSNLYLLNKSWNTGTSPKENDHQTLPEMPCSRRLLLSPTDRTFLGYRAEKVLLSSYISFLLKFFTCIRKSSSVSFLSNKSLPNTVPWPRKSPYLCPFLMTLGQEGWCSSPPAQLSALPLGYCQLPSLIHVCGNPPTGNSLFLGRWIGSGQFGHYLGSLLIV